MAHIESLCHYCICLCRQLEYEEHSLCARYGSNTIKVQIVTLFVMLATTPWECCVCRTNQTSARMPSRIERAQCAPLGDDDRGRAHRNDVDQISRERHHDGIQDASDMRPLKKDALCRLGSQASAQIVDIGYDQTGIS